MCVQNSRISYVVLCSAYIYESNIISLLLGQNFCALETVFVSAKEFYTENVCHVLHTVSGYIPSRNVSRFSS